MEGTNMKGCTLHKSRLYLCDYWTKSGFWRDVEFYNPKAYSDYFTILKVIDAEMPNFRHIFFFFFFFFFFWGGGQTVMNAHFSQLLYAWLFVNPFEWYHTAHADI